MNLANLATDLTSRIEKYNINQKLEQRAEDLQPIQLRWDSYNETISIDLLKLTVLCDREIAFIPQTLLNKAHSVSKLLEESKLVELIDLSNGSSLKKINNELQQLSNSLSDELQNYWGEFKEQIIPILPDNIQRGLGDNDSLLHRFKRAESDLHKVSQNLPNEAEKLINVINQMQEMSSNMITIVGKLQTDCPDYMNAFFNTVANGFKLNQLTPEMLKWLIQNGDAESFEIKKKRYSGY
ncbi:hypothetical protein [Colwellia polaris]|jgi:hypothetical protein|uniref:hypothetical protein n=1 Tax=Colwellia polaris TaxID=326537 RepID=UPI000A16E6F4|nr:hypothetical protein [Colwellia polaris]